MSFVETSALATTTIHARTDIRAYMSSTTLQPRIVVEGSVQPFVSPTYMRRLRTLSGLSQRRWASLLGVTHPTVRSWEVSDPQDTTKLALILSGLEQAKRVRGDLPRWVDEEIDGMALKPIELLAAGRMRAFRGAVNARTTHAPATDEGVMRARAKSEMTWPVPEIPTQVDADA